MSSTEQIQPPYPLPSVSRLCADRIYPVGINFFSQYSLYMPLSFFDPEIKRAWAQTIPRSFLKTNQIPHLFHKQYSISKVWNLVAAVLPVSKFFRRILRMCADLEDWLEPGVSRGLSGWWIAQVELSGSGDGPVGIRDYRKVAHHTERVEGPYLTTPRSFLNLHKYPYLFNQELTTKEPSDDI